MNKPSTSKKNEEEDQNIEDGELVETENTDIMEVENVNLFFNNFIRTFGGVPKNWNG